MLIDTHAHLDFPEFAADLEAILERASAAGVKQILSIGTSVESSRRAVELAEKNQAIFAVVGVHPSAAGEVEGDYLGELRELVKHPRVVGIGETGLDYHRMRSRMSGEEQAGEWAEKDRADGVQQAKVFQAQLELAAEVGLNVVIHERDAWEDTLAMLRPYSGRLRAVFHCFGKSPAHAEEIFRLGHVVSFTGIVTFKNAQIVQETAKVIPALSFMVETDCPYLAPVPYRGKRAEPEHVRTTAEWIARLRGVTVEELAAETTATARDFFRWPA